MEIDRRKIVIGSAGIGAGLALSAGTRTSDAHAAQHGHSVISVADMGVEPGADSDQAAALQRAIDTAANEGKSLHLPAGTIRTGSLTLRSGTNITGIPGKSRIELIASGAMITAENADGLRLQGITVSGSEPDAGGRPDDAALLVCRTVSDLLMTECRFEKGPVNGVSLTACSGRVSDCVITDAANTGLFCLDSNGLDISHNHVRGCGNNGIQVWQSKPGEDGSVVAFNRVEAIGAAGGGSGQNGNGINVFRAGSVQVAANHIADCAFSAIRGNAASNFQVTGNHCARLGEVAIYAEFGFQGTVIANNIVDRAASGISVTNFNEGGRMAVIQGNLIRNLFLREGEDKRGVGIAVEADAMVSGNVIEGAPGGGIMVGWGEYLRNVNVSGNLVREARIGIGISATTGAGYAFVTNNMLSATSEGGVRAMDHDKPLGPDLAKTSSESYRNMAVFGNVSL